MSPATGTAAATADPPDLSCYAPGVRISLLGATIQRTGETGTLLPGNVLGDLVRAEVTRVNTGASQYSLTFNNFFLSTAIDRDPRSDVFGDDDIREALDKPNNLPVWPRFKYNDFTTLKFGRRLRIDMRYVPQATAPPAAAGEQTSTSSWTPMVSGPITDVGFTFASGQGAQIGRASCRERV